MPVVSHEHISSCINFSVHASIDRIEFSLSRSRLLADVLFLMRYSVVSGNKTIIGSSHVAYSRGQHFAVFTAVLVLSALALLRTHSDWTENYGTVVVILLAIAAANMGLVPHSAPAYSFIFSYVVPMLIPLFLFQAMFVGLQEASRTTAAFLVATLGTVAGVIVAALLLDLSQLAPPPTSPPSERRE